MKKILILFLGLICITATSSLNAQNDMKSSPNFPKMDTSPMDMVIFRDASEKPMARIIYSRPQKRDRDIFGKLVPYGKVWRLGANESTEITLYEDMKVADATIPAGTYTMYAIPEEKEWTIILNENTNSWGAFDYKETTDVARINVPVRTSDHSLESFAMSFEKASEEGGTNLLIGWDNKFVKVPFEPAM